MSNEPIQSGMVDGRGLEAAVRAGVDAGMVTSKRLRAINHTFSDDYGAMAIAQDASKAALIAYLASSPNIGEVEVRELEWQKHPDDSEWYSCDDPSGDGLGLYLIRESKINVGEYELRISGLGTSLDTFGTPGFAMTAAQADYAQRVRSALVPSPQQHSSQVVSQEGGGDSQGVPPASQWGDPNDYEGVLYALDIAAIGAPYSDIQGQLYCARQYSPDGFRDAEFRDYGLARAVRILCNNAKAIRSALSTPLTETAKAEHAANPAETQAVEVGK